MDNQPSADTTNTQEIDKLKCIGLKLDDERFCDQQEQKIFKIHNKSYYIKKQLEEMNSESLEIAKLNVEKILKTFKREFYPLFTNNYEFIYAHIDLDSFYASVETVKNPDLANVPLGVGTMNMLATCNYKARKYGVRAGMPGYVAKKICPDIEIVKCDFGQYNMYSEKVMSILAMFDEDLEIYGIDEACLVFNEGKYKKAYNKMMDILANDTKNKDSVCNLNYASSFTFENVRDLVNDIRQLVFHNTKLTVSSGISVTRGLSKHACSVNKPNGCFVIDKDFDKHILDLETDKINGIGKATKELLSKGYDIKYVRDLREKLHLLYCTLPYKTFLNLFNLSYGLSIFDTNSRKHVKRQSIGISLTFRTTRDFYEICNVLWHISSTIHNKLTDKMLKFNIITLTYKNSNFKSATKQSTLNKYISKAEDIYNEGIELMYKCKVLHKDGKQVYCTTDLRLLGLSCSGLIDIDKINTLNFSDVVYLPKQCMICGKMFLHRNDAMFEGHVNLCLNEKEKEEKKKKGKLDYYIRIK